MKSAALPAFPKIVFVFTAYRRNLPASRASNARSSKQQCIHTIPIAILCTKKCDVTFGLQVYLLQVILIGVGQKSLFAFVMSQRADVSNPSEPTGKEIDHFRNSWAAHLLDDPQYIIRSMSSRRVKADLEDSLFGATLTTKDTIRSVLSFWRSPQADLGETIILASLGSGLNGHSGIVHGGFTAMLIDEASGLANMYHNDAHTFTANLNVNYRKPIPAPSVVLCRASITKTEGRKRFVRCTVEGPAGIIYADSVALFLEFKEGYKL